MSSWSFNGHLLSDLHAHDLFVSGYEFVSHLHDELEGYIGLFHGDHGPVYIRLPAGGEVGDGGVRFPLQPIDVVDGSR